MDRMRACRVVAEDVDDIVLFTDSFEKVKSYFRENLPWDIWTYVWCSIYDEKRYTINRDMDWDIQIYDKRDNEYIYDDWKSKREGLHTMPLDVRELVSLNPNHRHIQ